jgi:hypothetical protein
VQSKERRNVELKIIITHHLGDGVQPITEWAKLPMGSCKAFFLQVQPKTFHPPETYVAHRVGHGPTCTYHWTFVGYFELVGECVGSTQ